MSRENGKDGAGAQRQPETRTVIIDGSNVAHSSEGEVAVLANIRLVQEKLKEDGFEPVVLVDAALRHQIDQQAEFEKLVDEGEIRQAPAGTDADYFILAFARELDADVVSNDRFRDRMEAFPEETKERMIRYMIVNNEVVFERRNKRRHR